MTRTDEPGVERFHATSGRVTGWLTAAVAGAVAVAGPFYLDEGFPVWVIAASVLVAVLAWAVMLRPALWVQGEHLVMRNTAQTIHIRLAAVEEMALRQVLAVRAGDARWVSPVVGRTWRTSVRASRPKAVHGRADRVVTTVHYPDFVEERLRHLADEARHLAGVRAGSPEQLALPHAVRREWHWAPVLMICAAFLALVLTIVL